MTDEEKLHIAIVNTVERLCSDAKIIVTEDRKVRLVEKIEQRIQAGEPHDFAFSEVMGAIR